MRRPGALPGATARAAYVDPAIALAYPARDPGLRIDSADDDLRPAVHAEQALRSLGQVEIRSASRTYGRYELDLAYGTTMCGRDCEFNLYVFTRNPRENA